MMGLRAPGKGERTLWSADFHLQCGEFRIQMRVSTEIFRQRMNAMGDLARACDTHPDLVKFDHSLPHLKAALQHHQKIRIVAIGSSSTAGVAPVLPYPPRLEMFLREKYDGRMIDVINRGISGQEAPDELLRFKSDVFDEAPTLVIWQVGTNAIFHDLNREDVAAAIQTGLVQLAGLPADVVLMDLQYTQAMVDKLEASEDMVSRISTAAEKANVNVFRRFALMRRWVDDKVAEIGDLEDGADSHLHTGEWATDCISKAFGDAIALAVTAEGRTT
jgi:lysophospholipase L1-like esterase